MVLQVNSPFVQPFSILPIAFYREYCLSLLCISSVWFWTPHPWSGFTYISCGGTFL